MSSLEAALGPPANATARLAFRSFCAIAARDLLLFRRQLPMFMLRVVMQPVLFIFVFTVVFPHIGQGIGSLTGSSVFVTLLVPGTVGLAAFIQGTTAVALPLVVDLGYVREIEDRALAPLPIPALAFEKVFVATLGGVLAGLVVAPVAAILPTQSPDLDVNWPAFAVALVAAGLVGSSLGLVLGTWIKASQISQLFSFLIAPLTFLGACYFPWGSLQGLPWLQWLILMNPLVYVSEALRAAMAPSLPHMPYAVALGGALALAAVLFVFGVRQLQISITDR